MEYTRFPLTPSLLEGDTRLARRGCLTAERGRSPSAARGQAEALWKRVMSSGLTTRCEPRYLLSQMGTPQCGARTVPVRSAWQAETIWKRAMFSDQTTCCGPGRSAVQCNAPSPQFLSHRAKHQTQMPWPGRAGRFLSFEPGASLELGAWCLESVAFAYQTLANETGFV